MKLRRMLSLLTALLLVAQLPLSVLAVEADLYYGDVTITDTDVTHSTATETNKTEAHGGSVTVTQSNSETPTSNTVTVTTTAEDVTVTLDNVNIDVSDTGAWYPNMDAGEAAVSVDRAEGTTVTVELEGTSNLTSGDLRGGLEVSGEGNIVIQDTDNDGTLNATGGIMGAGIGSGTNVDADTQAITSDGKNITIAGGTINAEGGDYAAGIGGAHQGVGSNITIEGGQVETEGGQYSAGIGGGCYGDGSDITIKNGYVEAQGGFYGAGIGSGYSDTRIGTANGTNITIENGTVVANGGDHGAGIGGGMRGSGSEITIAGGNVTANGVDGGAGIGGGYEADGTSIAISGGEVTATGDFAAGIGGGYGSEGEDITISGGTVTATGGSRSAGIGGGAFGESEDIVLKEDANVTATGNGNAADIGDGSGIGSEEKQENKVDISELNPSGSFTGSDGEKIQGEYVPTVQPKPETPAPSYEEEEEEKAPASGGSTTGYSKGSVWSNGYISQTLFKVENGAGMKPDWSEKNEDGTLTITAENEPVVFTTWVNGLKYLQDKLGIHTIVIKTANCETELKLADLIAMNGTEYILTQEGETSGLTVDGKAVEIE